MAGKYVAAQTLQALVADRPGLELAGEPPVLYAAPEAVLAIGEELKASPKLQLNHLCSVTAVDYPEFLEVVYHFHSRELKHDLVMKVKLAKQGAEMPNTPSVVTLWPTAVLQEREVYDLLGVAFTGHPDLCRILLPDDFVGHPLRKDYKLPSQRERSVQPC